MSQMDDAYAGYVIARYREAGNELRIVRSETRTAVDITLDLSECGLEGHPEPRAVTQALSEACARVANRWPKPENPA